MDVDFAFAHSHSNGLSVLDAGGNGYGDGLSLHSISLAFAFDAGILVETARSGAFTTSLPQNKGTLLERLLQKKMCHFSNKC